ncbi:MAG: D-lyxose/D-mannose family sugar isomerase [bacterium]
MKRSEINQIIKNAVEFLDEMNFMLPPFAHWTPEQWAAAGPEFDGIRDNQLGWDITNFGGDDFLKLGLTIFTLRNGNYADPDAGKPYAEKVLIVEEEQITPMHFHRSKMEDIINRGGGTLIMQVFNSTPDGKLADTPVTAGIDGEKRTVPAGSLIKLVAGESITVAPLLYHKFWAEKNAGKLLVGEVSSVNDDKSDNFFLDEIGRFPIIEDDEPPFRLLMTEYPKSK